MARPQSRGRREGRASGADEGSLARARMAKEHRELQEAIRQTQRAMGMYALFEDLTEAAGPAAATSHQPPPSPPLLPTVAPPRTANMMPPHQSCLQEKQEMMGDFLRVVSTTQPIWQNSLSHQLGEDFQCASHEGREDGSSSGVGRKNASPARSCLTEPLLTMPEYWNKDVLHDQSEFFMGRRLPTEQAFFNR
ncbi:unnamed protein product [Victoria cruziana]